jgi:hypothetical protein
LAIELFEADPIVHLDLSEEVVLAHFSIELWVALEESGHASHVFVVCNSHEKLFDEV